MIRNQLEHDEIRSYRDLQNRREQRGGHHLSTPPSGLSGEMAMMYQFGFYPRTRNAEYGRKYGWNVIQRAWRMAHYRIEMITCIDDKESLGKKPGDMYLVRSQREKGRRYFVRMDHNHCSCPYRRSSGRKPCKHIILVAYLDYMMRNIPLPHSLMSSQGMDYSMSRNLGSVCDSIGRPLKNVRDFRKQMARRISEILGPDVCLYTGIEINRSIFNRNLRMGIMVMSNLLGPTDNQKAVTIRFIARPMMGLMRSDPGRRVWRVPVVETRAPGFSRRSLSIDVSSTVRQSFLYHVVELSISDGANCTCLKYNNHGLICEHIRAAVLADLVEPSSKLPEYESIVWSMRLSEWACEMNYGSIESEAMMAEEEEYNSSMSTHMRNRWYNPEYVGGSSITKDRLDSQVYESNGGAMSGVFVGNYYEGTIIGGYGRGSSRKKSDRDLITNESEELENLSQLDSEGDEDGSEEKKIESFIEDTEEAEEREKESEYLHLVPMETFY